MVSRNRSTCGVRPYIRATCNPDADSWVADFLSWWIDPESGYPLPERAGVLRYFIRIGETIEWADRAEELSEVLRQSQKLPPGIDPPRPMSVTFIPAWVFDRRTEELCRLARQEVDWKNRQSTTGYSGTILTVTFELSRYPSTGRECTSSL